MKYISGWPKCIQCGNISSKDSFVANDIQANGQVYTRIWIVCVRCGWSGWVHLRRDWYDLHGQTPPT